MSSQTSEVPDTASSNPDGYSVQVQSRDDESKAYREHLLPTLQRHDLPSSAVKHLPGEVGGGISGTAHPIGDEISGTSQYFHGDEFTTTRNGDQQESDKTTSEDPKTIQSRDFYKDPLELEVEQSIPKVKNKLQESCDKFPLAYGLVVAFSNEVGCENTQRIPNIHTSGETVCRAFSKLGYAHCIFTEYQKVEILAVYHQLSRMVFPSSYKAIFIYFTGHGQRSYISTTDGYLSINHLKSLLLNSRAPNLVDIVKVLFFDCCRTNSLNMAVSQSSATVENLVVIYMAPLGQKSFIVNAAGMSVATIELVKLLERSEHCTLTKLLSVDLCRKVQAAASKLNAGPMGTELECCSLNKTMDLYQDKMRAMSPTEVHLCEDYEHDMCTMTWKKPLHADHQQLISFYIAYLDDHEKWETLQDDIPASATSYELCRVKASDKQLTVGACYSLESVLAREYGNCPAVQLESDTIKPVDVWLIIVPNQDSTLTWSPASGLGDNQLVSIQHRNLTSNNISEADWVMIENKIQVEETSYHIKENVETYEFRMKVHARNMDSIWVPARKRNVNCSSGQRQRGSPAYKNSSRVCLLIFSLVLLYTANCLGFYFSKPTHTDLAVAGDVIDCERLQPWQKWLYSVVSITQVATDVLNDNKKGLDMKILSIQRDKLFFTTFSKNGTAITNITRDTKPFVIPDDYFSRPYYMWEGSNITVSVRFSDYTKLPDKMTAYIICGDDNLNSFTYNPHSRPHSEYSFNLLDEDNQTFHYTVQKHGYYYVVVQAESEYQFHFFAEVQFDIFFLDSDDYSFSRGSDSEAIGQTVKSGFGIYDKNITLCSISEQQVGDFDSNTIHVLLKYGLRSSIVFVVPLCVLLFLIVLIIFLICCAKPLIICYQRGHSQVRHYEQLQQYDS